MKKFSIFLTALFVGLSATSALACPGHDVKAGGGMAAAQCTGACMDKMASAKTADACKPGEKHDCQVDMTLDIKGMACADCVGHVTKALKSVKGVEAVTVDLKTATAQVSYCSKDLKHRDAMLRAVKKAGFSATFAKAPAKVEAPKTEAPAVEAPKTEAPKAPATK